MLRAALPELLTAAVAFGLGAMFLLAIKPGAGVPEAAGLQDANGTLSWLTSSRYGLQFGFNDDPRRFEYSSKGNAIGDVLSALKSAGQKQTRVRYDAKSRKPIFSNDEYLDVYDIAVEDQPIRTYDEIKQAWVANDRIGRWVGSAFLGCGVVLLWGAVKKVRTV